MLYTTSESSRISIIQRPDLQEGRPVLAEMGVAVRRVAQWRALGFSPQAIANLMGHITLAHIDAALTFYETHRAEIDADLAQDEAARTTLPLCPPGSTAPAEPLRLYIDEDSLWHPLWLALHAHHADVLTALAVNLMAMSSAEHLSYATIQNRLLLTFNASEYWDLHTFMRQRDLEHAGIVVLRPQAASVEDVAHRLLELSATHSAAQLNNGVWRLD